MATIDEIKNNALLLIGAQPETDFYSSTTKKAIICNNFYEAFRKRILGMNRWTFARKREEILAYGPTTNQKYGYEFDLPTDFIHLLAMYTDNKYLAKHTRFEIMAGKIYADVDTLYMYYIYDTTEDLMPDYFVEFFKTAFAAEICFYLTGDKDLTAMIHQKAYGSASDNSRGGLYGIAAKIDAGQNMVKVIEDSPFIAARFSGVD